MGRKKQKVRWTSVDQEGFFTNESEVSEKIGNKDFSYPNNSNVNSNYYNPSKRIYRRVQNKKPKYGSSQEKDSKSPDDTSVAGCDSKDCNTCTCEQYCCCTNNEHSSICDDLTNKSDKNSSETLKMDQTKSESNNDGNSNSDLNESNANGKDCDTNSEHSSMMNGSIHSSYNNSNRSLNIHRMESFSSSGTGSREYERHSNHGERRYERKYNYNRDGSRRSYGGSDRGGGSSWINAPLAPRFERKAAIHAANAAANGNNYHSHHYGDQNGSNGCYDDNMSMDMEDLPNGFTKIRSKNLDVLFKKDYYAQRVHLNSGSSGTGAAASLNSCSVSPNPQAGTTQQNPSEHNQTGENDKTGSEETVGEAELNGSKDAKTIATVESIGSNNSSTQNSNEIGDNNSSILSKETNMTASIEDSKTAQISNSNHAIQQKQASLNQTESDESNANSSANKISNGNNVSTEFEQAESNNDSRINSDATPFYPKNQLADSNVEKTSVDSSTNNDEAHVPISHSASTQNELGSMDKAPTTISGAGNNKRPSLFLYAPSSNTIIPCEEIIIPNHPNVMQEPMNMSLEQKLASDTSISCEPTVESNSTKTDGVEDGNKENRPDISFAQNTIMEYPTDKSEVSTSRIPLMPAGTSENVDNASKNTPVSSTTTPGMNGNAPAFIPRAQQQYFPASLNIHQVPQQPHAMIHYDQFGAPYTSFHGSTVPLPTQTTLSTGHIAPTAPGMPNMQQPIFNREYIPSSLPYHTQSSVLSNITVASSNDMLSGTSPTTPNGNLNSSSETSSAESSAAMHSPADLSVYSPANWVPSPSQTTQAPNLGENPRNGNIMLQQPVPLARVEGSEVPSTGSRTTQQQHGDYHRSMSSPASYSNQQTHVSGVNGTIPYGPEGPIAYTQRSQYPPHFNSHVYYQPSAAAAHYINNQGGSNVWYNLQQQYYSMNGGQAFVGPQYQGYANGYTNGGTNLQFMCESSTMPSSAGDSMAEDDPRDRSEEEIEIQNRSRTHLQGHLQSQGQLMKPDFKPHLSGERDKYKLQKQPYARHPMSNNATVMVSTNPGPGTFAYKKEKETREGSHGKDEVPRPFIPGLPAERLTNKRVHKKRRKKKNTSAETLSVEQNSIVASSSIILPEGHCSLPALAGQQHQKGKNLNNMHRGSSSSEDLFSESTMIRSENKLPLPCTNSINNERECQFDSSNKRLVSKFATSKGSTEGCEEIINDSKVNNELSSDKHISNIKDSSIAKSSGCDKEKAAYQVCETLTEVATEGAMPSLPTTSPSSPQQSINPSSSSLLISSSCVSSQDEDDNDKDSGKITKQRGIRTDIRRGAAYESRMPNRNRHRDRSSSISSNEENGVSCKNKVSENPNGVPINSNTKQQGNTPNFDKEKEDKVTSEHKSNAPVVEDSKRNCDTEVKSKYSDTVKRFNTAAMREAALSKVEDNLKLRAENDERNQKPENRISDGHFSKQGRNYNYEHGSQTKNKNRRSFNVSNSFSSNDKNQKNSTSRSNQASQSPYKLQRSISSQNPQANNIAEEAPSEGKKLYSKVALKATDTNMNSVHNVPNKSPVQNKRSFNTKQSLSATKDEVRSNKKSADKPLEVQGKEIENIEVQEQKKNSTDDAGWQMGGSKTKRNRKGTRTANNTMNNSELSRDSSTSNKSMKGTAEYSEESLDSTIKRDNLEMDGIIKTADEKKSKEVDNSRLVEKSVVKDTTLEKETSQSNNQNGALDKALHSTEEKSSSVPSSKSSTLRKQRKKRSSQDVANSGVNQVEKSTSASTIRPVLIQDGLIDIFGKGSSSVAGTNFTGKLTNSTSAINLFEQAKIDEVVQKGHMDSLFVSEIGYGMIGGPISMGRFGMSKYTPPDRSEEIRPMQELLKEKQKADEEAEAASKNTVIKVLMGEVQVSTAAEVAESSVKVGEDNLKTSDKFEDITDKICEDTVESQKSGGTKLTSNITSQPADLDLD